MVVKKSSWPDAQEAAAFKLQVCAGCGSPNVQWRDKAGFYCYRCGKKKAKGKLVI